MSWNFRLVREDDIISLREVYYDDVGNPEMMTTGEVKIYAELGEDVVWYQEHMSKRHYETSTRLPFHRTAADGVVL